MSPEITYRLATVSDLDTLVALRCDFLRDVVPDESLEQPVIDNIRAYFAETLPTGDFVAWLAESDSRIIATSGLVMHRHPPTRRNPTGRLAYIMNIYTVPAFRRRGIATTLLTKLLDTARAANCGRVSLHALADGKSIYVKAGFTSVKSEMRLDL